MTNLYQAGRYVTVFAGVVLGRSVCLRLRCHSEQTAFSIRLGLRYYVVDIVQIASRCNSAVGLRKYIFCTFFANFVTYMIKEIKIEDYTYDLPEERIAKFPLQHRDDSKLLVYTSSSGESPVESQFKSISHYLPSGALMVFNETKVVPARMLFQRASGAIIEIFCLEPDTPSDYQINFASTAFCRWKVIVGNLKKWKGDTLSLFNTADDPEISAIGLKADLVSNDGKSCIVEFSWNTGISFSSVLTHCGRIPIPPYLKRDTQDLDITRYQTCYALREGSVAAPTAGLHFTQKEFDDIDAKGIRREKLCLHVGAGTFMPVKSEYIADHTMHSEPFEVSLEFLTTLRKAVDGPVIAVGTTSTRCLESLYFLGVQCIERGKPESVSQWEPYRDSGYPYSTAESLDALICYLKSNNLDRLVSRTQIIIVPGYRFNVINYLVTNFHQPQSTLLLLIAAFIGETWRDLYRFAMDNGFRFLSYGDSSLLQKKENIQI